MKIIVLGMDNTGKTTLCKNLNKIFNFKVINSLSINSEKEEIENYLIENLKSNEDLIFERFSLFDEMIYGKVLRKKSKFDFDSEIYKMVKEIKPFFIYCRPKDNIILNWKDRKQMEGIIDNSKKLIEEWDKLVYKLVNEQCYTHFIYWDYNRDNLEDLKGIIEHEYTRNKD